MDDMANRQRRSVGKRWVSCIFTCLTLLLFLASAALASRSYMVADYFRLNILHAEQGLIFGKQWSTYCYIVSQKGLIEANFISASESRADWNYMKTNNGISSVIISMGRNAYVFHKSFAPGDGFNTASEWPPDRIVFSGLGFYAGGHTYADDGAQLYGVSIPYWFTGLVALIWPVRVLVLFLRLKRRRSGGLCVTCGYDLRGTPDMCPECGPGVVTGAERGGGIVGMSVSP